MGVNWRRILWGVGADKSREDQEHIDWAHNLLTPEQKYKKFVAEIFDVPRYLLADVPYVSAAKMYKHHGELLGEEMKALYKALTAVQGTDKGE